MDNKLTTRTTHLSPMTYCLAIRQVVQFNSLIVTRHNNPPMSKQPQSFHRTAPSAALPSLTLQSNCTRSACRCSPTAANEQRMIRLTNCNYIFPPLGQQSCTQEVLDLAFFCYPIAKKLKITVLVVSIFVSTRKVHYASRPVKRIQLRANVHLDVFVRMFWSHPACTLRLTPQFVVLCNLQTW
jgi:hypothetical protein